MSCYNRLICVCRMFPWLQILTKHYSTKLLYLVKSLLTSVVIIIRTNVDVSDYLDLTVSNAFWLLVAALFHFTWGHVPVFHKSGYFRVCLELSGNRTNISLLSVFISLAAVLIKSLISVLWWLSPDGTGTLNVSSDVTWKVQSKQTQAVFVHTHMHKQMLNISLSAVQLFWITIKEYYINPM